MNATENQTVVASFISFLRQQNISEEHTEGIESNIPTPFDILVLFTLYPSFYFIVAIQCLSEAFELNDSLIKYLSVTDLASLIKGSSSSSSVPVSSDNKAEAERQKVQGNEFIAANKPEKALECYSQAINLDPSNAIYFSNRAAAHSMLGDHFSALEDAKQSCNLNPNYAKAYNRLGKAHLALGEPEDAVVAFTKALEIDPKDSTVKASLESARRASSGESEEVSKASPRSSQFPGMPAGMDFANIMNNPQFMSMAQQMMQSGALNDMLKDPKTKDMMSDFMANPELMKKFAGSK